MTARPLRRVGAALALLLAAASTGCTSDPAPDPAPRPEPTYTVAAGLCDKLDFSSFTAVFGKPSPLGVGKEDRPNNLRCWSFFTGLAGAGGGRDPGGSVTVELMTFASAAEATAAFDRAAPTPTATPFPGASVPRPVRAQYSRDDPGSARVKLLDRNVVVDVVAATVDHEPPERGDLPTMVAAFAVRALEALRAG